MRLKTIIGIFVVLVGVGIGLSTFRKSLTPYIIFKEAKKSAGVVQIHGSLVSKGTYNSEKGTLEFELMEKDGEKMNIVYSGVKPANFEQATSVVAIGTYREGIFYAEQILIKCPSKYQGLETK